MTSEKMVPIDEDIWDEGRRARSEGKSVSDCPFPAEHPLTYSWLSGFFDGSDIKDQEQMNQTLLWWHKRRS
jgi:hypothetical protein